MFLFSGNKKKEYALKQFSKTTKPATFFGLPKPKIVEVDVLVSDWWFEGKPSTDFDRKLQKWAVKKKIPSWALTGLSLQLQRVTIQRQLATINQTSHKPKAAEKQGDISFPYLKLEKQRSQNSQERSDRSQHSQKGSKRKSSKKSTKSAKTTDKNKDDTISSYCMDTLMDQIMNCDDSKSLQSETKWDPWKPLEEIANRPEFVHDNIITNTTYSTALVLPSPDDKTPGRVKSKRKNRRVNFAPKQKVGIYDRRSMTPAIEGLSEPIRPPKMSCFK